MAVRKFFFSFIVFTGLISGPAMAQAPIYNWSGFYVGTNAGGSWGRSNTDVTYNQPSKGGVVTKAFGSASKTMGGVLGGLQAGYNFQTSPFVFGIETDLQITSQQGNTSWLIRS
jgi:outer membrane immunogenic protein